MRHHRCQALVSTGLAEVRGASIRQRLGPIRLSPWKFHTVFMLCASVMIRTTSAGSSATRDQQSGSMDEILPEGRQVCIHDSRPCQYSRPTSTIGNRVIFPGLHHAMASNSSSRVLLPRCTTNACEYLTNTVLRTKKYRNSMFDLDVFVQALLQRGVDAEFQTDTALPLVAPLLAASMMPGPPR